MLVKEAAELIELAIFEHLKPVEGCRDLIRRRYLCHLGDGLVEQMVLTLDQSIVVSEHVLQLLHASVARSASIILIVDSARTDLSGVWKVRACKHRIIALVKDRHGCHFFVDRHHELLEPLEIQTELLDEFASILLEVDIEELVTDGVYLMGEGLLSFGSWIFRGTELSLESLGEHILLQVDNLHFDFKPS